MESHSFVFNPSLSVSDSLVAQATLEEALEPQSPSHESTNRIVEDNLGMILLSVITLFLMVFLLLKRQVREVRFGIMTTLLIGTVLPIILIVQITTQLLEQSSTVNSQKTRTGFEARPTLASGNESAVSTPEEDPGEDNLDPTPTEESSPAGEIVPSTTEESPTEESSPEATTVTSTRQETALERTNSEPETVVSPPASTTTEKPNSEETRVSPPREPATSSGESSSTLGERELRNTEELTRGASQRRNLARSRPDSPTTSNPTRTPVLRSNPASNPPLRQPTRPPEAILLKLGDRGIQVSQLQQALTALGFYEQDVDGDFGRRTEVAVKQFQVKNNLIADGVVGFSTCKILQAQVPHLEINCVPE